ncbi:hypothetical protein TSUD_154410 [Trifolium subterraneum]|uniref:Uncharacterized protein n=1 Tax=Trifolium subterraneum TaxID=3900 RepID=A0A2Z6N624_TRISU|nr:hypothetical protein TSUD_154410 [Trifolium subterraneum]
MTTSSKSSSDNIITFCIVSSIVQLESVLGISYCFSAITTATILSLSFCPAATTLSAGSTYEPVEETTGGSPATCTCTGRVSICKVEP